jgi:signal transduction histidine kinase
MDFMVALPALTVANHEAEMGRLRSQALLEDLQGTQRWLMDYAGQVEELAWLQERGRLARELHDTGSQLVLCITLTSRSAQMLPNQDPGRAREPLERPR